MKRLFQGQAVKCEMVVLLLEKWGLHPDQQEISTPPDLNDLAREAAVFVPDDEQDQANEILYGESEFDRAGF